MLTSKLGIRLRNMTRSIGINKIIGTLLSRGYEERFGPALQAKIKEGDIVWDIGANLGLYTSIFADQTGPNGKVVAFEPTPVCFNQLTSMFSASKTVVLKNLAVGDEDASMLMVIESDAMAATHRLVVGKIEGDCGGEAVQEVAVRTAASLVQEQPDIFPNVVKIDVEGHEGAVLDGFEQILKDARLHCIGIEMHFGLLSERGQDWYPKRIESLLTGAGFSLHWTDPSHVIATK